MKYKIILSRTFVTNFEIEAESEAQALSKFKEAGDEIYAEEMEQCNVVSETVMVEGDDDSERICSATGEVMSQGWVTGGGDEYFKYERHAIAWAVDNNYANLQEAYDDDAIYWTSWES